MRITNRLSSLVFLTRVRGITGFRDGRKTPIDQIPDGVYWLCWLRWMGRLGFLYLLESEERLGAIWRKKEKEFN